MLKAAKWTFAYRAVVSMSRCRSTWTISGSAEPVANMSGRHHVAEPVGARVTDPRPSAGSADHGADGGHRHRLAGRCHLHEHTADTTIGTATSEIGSEGFADTDRQRQRVPQAPGRDSTPSSPRRIAAAGSVDATTPCSWSPCRPGYACPNSSHCVAQTIASNRNGPNPPSRISASPGRCVLSGIPDNTLVESRVGSARVTRQRQVVGGQPPTALVR